MSAAYLLHCCFVFKLMQAYRKSRADSQMPPHVYGKCQDILRSMHFSAKNQCCVLTGDSASGKTECLKHILQYIVNASPLSHAGFKRKFSQVRCLHCTLSVLYLHMILLMSSLDVWGKISLSLTPLFEVSFLLTLPRPLTPVQDGCVIPTQYLRIVPKK